MAVEQDDGGVGQEPGGGTAPFGDLFRRLTNDTKDLVRQEMNLAKLEMKEAARQVARDLVGVAMALALAAVGGLALTAFLIMVIGELLDAFWLGALIVGAVLLLIGGVMARSAIKDLQDTQDLKPDDTVETLREDKEWAQQEARDMKRELKS